MKIETQDMQLHTHINPLLKLYKYFKHNHHKIIGFREKVKRKIWAIYNLFQKESQSRAAYANVNDDMILDFLLPPRK